VSRGHGACRFARPNGNSRVRLPFGHKLNLRLCGRSERLAATASRRDTSYTLGHARHLKVLTLRATFHDLDRGTRPAALTAWRRWRRCTETRRGSSAWWPFRRQAPSQNRRVGAQKYAGFQKTRIEFSRGVDVLLGVVPGVRPESRRKCATATVDEILTRSRTHPNKRRRGMGRPRRLGWCRVAVPMIPMGRRPAPVWLMKR
jgi:hypothetical protein